LTSSLPEGSWSISLSLSSHSMSVELLFNSTNSSAFLYSSPNLPPLPVKRVTNASSITALVEISFPQPDESQSPAFTLFHSPLDSFTPLEA